MSPIQRDRASTAGEELCFKQRFGCHLHPGRVRDVSVGLGKADLHRLNLQVNAVGGIDWVARQLKMLEDTQSDQCSQTLAVWRNLVKAGIPVGLRHGCDPFDCVATKILLRQQAPGGPGVCRDFLSQGSTVEGLTVRGRNLLQCRRVVGCAEPFAGSWATAGQEGVGKGGKCRIAPFFAPAQARAVMGDTR